ncbi:flagellar basal body-associated FliL family protein [Parvibaculum sp.]|uniref:flagellar basal body-associated FliL family protein n=1 Tax=Parvibaculum sp. TaxID=2024848 RepID=UPI000C9735CC|nr:flagellar basal body-associated FliL family protein [Parvibaculum sp.]MAB14634.1 flagellar basal body-associated protein FliL [Parvibaculum sp.]
MTATDVDPSTEVEGVSDKSEKKSGPNKLVLVGGLVAVLLVVGGAGAWFTGMLGGSGAPTEEKVAVAPVFYDLPDFLSNLSGPPPQRYLKMRVSLQLENQEASKIVDQQLPRVLDGFQTYLRQLRPEDLKGSAAMMRLKEELLRRLNLAIQPPVVKDILFKEIIVQ